ncbi:LysM peptidoglycan-binding domain-containing protein [Lactobacillus sp. S2-2]|nr:LysM peptidoglycan-binding domain-containing protein [Lactobacillus sp. S2-2]
MKSVIAASTTLLGLLLVGISADASTKVTVQSGDTVSKLANRNNVSISDVEKANNLSNINMIYVGQELIMPTSGDQTQSYTQVQQPQNTTTQQNNQVQSNQTQANYSSNVSGNDNSAKSWIANRESSGSYSARNGQYVGKYQLSSSYLNGDYSAANQERVADNYVNSRYGSWSAAKSFWLANGWY